MKKLLLVPALFLLGLFIFSKPAFAQTCVCQYNYGGNPTVIQDDCQQGAVAACRSGPQMGEVSCECTSDCTPQDRVPTLTKPCCEGLKTDPRGQICIPAGVDPYKNCYWSNPPSDGICCGNYHNDGKGNCIKNDTNAKQMAFLCDDKISVNTAIGCIPVSNTDDFLAFILRWAIGIGGGIAFFLIILASFMIMTSAGNPERQKAGQELLTSAIAGLIMLIFSVFILKVIGVDILKLPGINL